MGQVSKEERDEDKGGPSRDSELNNLRALATLNVEYHLIFAPHAASISMQRDAHVVPSSTSTSAADGRTRHPGIVELMQGA
jgi:hypothetical protein